MSNYLIGVGGTGAKCIEAIAQLGAAGILPKDDLFTIFVDPDAANGNLERSQVALNTYGKCQALHSSGLDLFRTKIEASDTDVWSPFTENGTGNSLQNSLGYSRLKDKYPEGAHLFDVLYSKDERQADLGVGFRGHPSIGAAVLGQTITFAEKEPWVTFRSRIDNDKGAGSEIRIFIVGSIFGGTGASGLPTLAKLVRQELDEMGADAQIGCALMLPYFSFDFPANAADEVKAESSNFVANTRSALRYYWQQDISETYDCMYVLGDEAMSKVGEASVGGKTQRNDPHFMELYAGLAAADFFGGERKEDVRLVARNDQDSLTWSDLPYAEQEKLEPRMRRMAQFAFSFLAVYDPALKEVTNWSAYSAPWYVDFFQGASGGPIKLDDPEVKTKLEALRHFCRSHLEWIAQLQTSASRDIVDLYQWQAFATSTDHSAELRSNFTLDRFASLTEPRQEESDTALHDVWTYMCSRPKVRGATGLNAFVRALYDATATVD